MNVAFCKMQAQGNDFVIVDALQGAWPAWHRQAIMQLCDRRLGIGCDQLLILQPHEDAHALMVIYNADGSQAANCGNGLRCVGDMLMRKLGLQEVRIALADRVVVVSEGKHGVGVNMGQALIEHVAADYVDVNMGNLHRVYFKNALPCPERNVEIISSLDATGDAKHATIRIIERGTGETQACGSGACATAAAIRHQTGQHNPFIIHMPGGDVHVSFDGVALWLQGEVRCVFTGYYALD